MDKDLKKIVDALVTQGFTTDTRTSGHVMVFLNGKAVTTFSGTAGDAHAYRHALARLKREGFKWPPPSKKEKRKR